VLNLWGWFIACRLVGGGEAFLPALISSACQSIVYGLYFSFSLVPGRGGSGEEGDEGEASKKGQAEAPPRPTRAARVFELQIAQYVVCAAHSIVASVWGNFPSSLAFLHLFVIGNGLVLYTDFHSRKPMLPGQLHVGPADGHAAALAAKAAAAARPKSRRRVTFSFDSCGWLMVYHFGVGFYLMEHLGLDDKEPREGVAFSGSSGGSLVSCVLAAGTNIKDVFEYVLEWHPACRKNPLKMFTAVQRALEKYQYPGAPARLTGRLRVLLTRVLARPPFVMGEVADTFPDNKTAVDILCASCHVPMVAGILPKRIGSGYYYDGLVWPSRLLVPWRGEAGDHVVRVSASGAPLADIRIQQAPFWWAILPPNPDVLRGIFWVGYRDAARYFAAQPRPSSLASCSCRRDAPSEEGGGQEGAEADEGGDGALARWTAAVGLSTERGGGAGADKPLVPERDPKTGQEVQALIDEAEAMAGFELRAANVLGLVLVLLAVAAVGLGFVLLPSFVLLPWR